MTDPHATILWSVAFEHALSLICTPQRTSNGALSWSSPSDEQMKYVRAWANFVAAKALGAVPGVEPGAEQITALARGMYLVYAADLGWRRSYDQSPMRRWSTSDVIADGEPKLFGGAAKYAMNDGSSAGELESDAWHAVARAFFDAVAACVGREQLRAAAAHRPGGALHGRAALLADHAVNLGPSLYHAYTEHLGGKSSYADHEVLPGWSELHETHQRAWRLAAKHAWGQL